MIRTALLAAAALIVPAAMGQALTTAFTYQGDLSASGAAANGVHDLRFTMWDAAAGGSQIGSVLCSDNVTIANGKFAVALDFGSNFNGQRRWLQVEVRADGGLNCSNAAGFTVLSPRQELTAGPNALYAINAGSASLLGGQPASFFTNAANLTGTVPDARLSANVAQLSTNGVFTGFPSFNGGTTGSSAPFTVDSTFRVDNLNADLLDGLDSGAFATTSHTHDATAIVSGLLADARLTTNIPRLNVSNTFSGATNTFNAVRTTNLRVSATLGLLDFYDTLAAPHWSIGMSSSDFVINDTAATPDVTRFIIDNSTGNIGIGNTAPARPLHVGTQAPTTGNSQGMMRFSSGASTGNFRSFDVGVRNLTNNTATDYDFVIDDTTRAGDEFNINWDTGNIGIGTSSPAQKLDVAGTVRCFVLEITGGADLSEKFDIAPASDAAPAPVPGMVVCIDPDHPGALRVASGEYDSTVAGIIAGANGVQPGMILTQKGSPADGELPVALSGRVWAYADGHTAAIKPGDLLTTSATPGYLMKSIDAARAQGAIVGKAMTSLPEGERGFVLVLVNLH